MASDNDKSSNNHNLDGSLKSNKKLANSGSIGDNEDKSNLGVHPVGKGGRHLSIPFDSATANGDISYTVQSGIDNDPWSLMTRKFPACTHSLTRLVAALSSIVWSNKYL